MDRGQIVKDSEVGIQLTKTQHSLWQPHPQHIRTNCNDDVSNITDTKTVTQCSGSDVLITYTTRKKRCGRYAWMPLPKSPLGQRDFALITMDQKQVIDNDVCRDGFVVFFSTIIVLTFPSFCNHQIIQCPVSAFWIGMT